MSFGSDPRLEDVLGSGSALSALLPGYEERPGQRAMAEAVLRALESHRSLLVEAGTGTGKTLAYLVPAILSRRKVVVSTATKALQDQLFTKDVPLVKELLAAQGIAFRAVLMKGLSNYVCKRRLREAMVQATADRRLYRIADWEKESETGDHAELVDLPEDDPAWLDARSGSDTRIGPTCAYYEECFATRMRRDAEEADLVIVNHHLYCADLALRRTGRGEAGVLPAHDAVIFDEVHQLEDVATIFFGSSVSSARVEALVRDARRAYDETKARGPARPVFELVLEASGRFFAELARAGAASRGRGQRPLASRDVTSEVRREWHRLDGCLEGLVRTSDATRPAEAQIARRASEVRRALNEVFDALEQLDRDAEHFEHDAWEPDEHRRIGRVPWIEERERSVVLGTSPVELGPDLEATLFDGSRAVIGTSATLATTVGGAADFSFAKERLGAIEADELLIPSPFDFPRRAGMYVPRDLPEPADPAFDDAAAQRTLELLELSGGGAFVLCTSVRSMQALHGRLAARLPPGAGPLLVQGRKPKGALLSEFRAARHAVLVATMSFWEGVDVPGDALRLVVMDKIPFPVPTDPVVAARSQALEARGENAFRRYSLPAAAITLKQGFGRLLRSERDAGVVALLDRRVLAKSYGRVLLDALPPAQRLRSLEDVRRFWSEVFPDGVV